MTLNHYTLIDCNKGLLSRNLAAMEALNLPNTTCIETDVTDISSFKQAIFQAEEKFGPVDCLINNAGIDIPAMLRGFKKLFNLITRL